MKSQRKSFRGMSRSHLFLIELIIVILFFSFAGAITVQVFSKAHELAQGSTALNGAVMAIQTAAETDKTVRFDEIGASPNTIYYNAGWELTNPVDAAYTITSRVVLEERPAGVMAVYHYTAAYTGAPDTLAPVTVPDGDIGDKIIYELETKKYYPGAVISGAAASENAAGIPSADEVN